jgi:hypothetical protein
MFLVDAGAHYEHVKVIRCDITPGSVERSRDIDFRKNPKGVTPLGTHFQIPTIF